MTISPLAQRQAFQAANVEAVRVAHMVGEQLQREAVRKEAADQKLAEDQNSVRGIPGAERIRTEERQGKGESGGGTGAEEPEEKGDQEEVEMDNSAGPAEKRLDFLA